MILKTDYRGDEKGFSFENNLQIDIEKDAEALGYITFVTMQMSLRLAELVGTVNPKHIERINKGIIHAENEMKRENNDKYPFTTYLRKDEV